MKRELRAFSLVEVLAAVAIIGILVFLALPNVIQAKKDTEEQMVIARAEALNMSISSFITANGRTNAGTKWTAATTEAAKFDLVKGYLAYAPASLSQYQPTGYTFTLSLDSKVTITGPAVAPSTDSTPIYY